MNKVSVFIFLLILSLHVRAQQDFFVFKKGFKIIQSYREGSYIAFQEKSKDWRTGYITSIRNDSFTIKPRIVVYNFFRNDTLYLPLEKYSITEIFNMPKKGVMVDYIDGRYQISRSGSRVKWLWIKNGWIFIAGSLGYLTLNVINGISHHNFSFKDSHPEYVLPVFAIGELLHHSYKPTVRIGNSYHIDYINLSKANK